MVELPASPLVPPLLGGSGAESLLLPPGFLPEKAAGKQYRVLFVHAHPDDEVLSTGATIALLARMGIEVYVVTATRGELGEVIPEDLRHLEQGLPKPGREGTSIPDGGVALGRVRSQELAEAMRVLGVSAWTFLGEPPALAAGVSPVAYRNSGMQWGPNGLAQAANTVTADSFSQRPIHEPASHLAACVRMLRPDVVVTYGADGGYGHPDHVRAHEVTMSALDMAASSVSVGRRHTAEQVLNVTSEGWNVPLVHTIVSPFSADGSEYEPGVLTVEGPREPKRAAMVAHRTQIVVRGDECALSNLVFRPITVREKFRTVRRGASGRATPVARWKAVAVAIGAGFGASMLGTVLHGQVFSGFMWGLVAALVLVLALMVLIGSWARSAAIGALVGVATYGGCMVWSLPRGQVGLIMGDVAGNTWVLGVPVLTVLFFLAAALTQRRKNPS